MKTDCAACVPPDKTVPPPGIRAAGQDHDWCGPCILNWLPRPFLANRRKRRDAKLWGLRHLRRPQDAGTGRSAAQRM